MEKYLATPFLEFIWLYYKPSAFNFNENNYLHGNFSRSLFTIWASLRNTKNRLISKFNHKIISFFLQNNYSFKKIYILICNTYIFCLKIYFSKEIYFSYKFLLARAVRSSPKCIRKKRWRDSEEFKKHYLSQL